MNRNQNYLFVQTNIIFDSFIGSLSKVMMTLTNSALYKDNTSNYFYFVFLHEHCLDGIPHFGYGSNRLTVCQQKDASF